MAISVERQTETDPEGKYAEHERAIVFAKWSVVAAACAGERTYQSSALTGDRHDRESRDFATVKRRHASERDEQPLVRRRCGCYARRRTDPHRSGPGERRRRWKTR
jgi:hypothetical protein